MTKTKINTGHNTNKHTHKTIRNKINYILISNTNVTSYKHLTKHVPTTHILSLFSFSLHSLADEMNNYNLSSEGNEEHSATLIIALAGFTTWRLTDWLTDWLPGLLVLQRARSDWGGATHLPHLPARSSRWEGGDAKEQVWGWVNRCARRAARAGRRNGWAWRGFCLMFIFSLPFFHSSFSLYTNEHFIIICIVILCLEQK